MSSFKVVKGYQYYWHLQSDGTYTDIHPDYPRTKGRLVGGVPFTKGCKEDLEKGNIERRGYATFFPEEHRLVITQDGLSYDTHGVVYFECNNLKEAELILGFLIKVDIG